MHLITAFNYGMEISQFFFIFLKIKYVCVFFMAENSVLAKFTENLVNVGVTD